LAVEEEPIPEPSDLAKKVAVLESNQEYILAAVTDLNEENEAAHAKIAELEDRVEELEVSGVGNKKTIYVTGDKGTMYEQYGENKSGYPLMRKHEPVIRYETGDPIIVHPERVRADGAKYFWMVIEGKGTGFYVRADKVS